MAALDQYYGTTGEFEAAIGRKLSWFERMGYWWSNITESDSKSYVPCGELAGAYTAWSAETFPKGAAAGEAITNAAEVTTKVISNNKTIVVVVLVGIGLAIFSSTPFGRMVFGAGEATVKTVKKVAK